MSDFVVPGQPITREQGFLRGHGAYLQHPQTISEGEHGVLVASVAGRISRINKLICVTPVKARFSGEVGDLLVGRVTSVDAKRWRVHVASQKDAVLQLNSINLPGGDQRMKTYEDQLSMRSLFVEGDLVCAEVQNVNAEGVISLHSRSLKYGKLENGHLVVVPCALIRRLSHHYVSLACGVDVILGKNGWIWVTRSVPEAWKNMYVDDDITPLVETLQQLRAQHIGTPLTADERMRVARTRNAILALSGEGRTFEINPDTIMSVYDRSVELHMHPADMTRAASVQVLVAHL